MIPSFNPEELLVELVKKLRGGSPSEIVVVNDGSNSKSDPVFRSLSAMPGVHLVHNKKNLGKGGALKQGFNYILKNFPDNEGVITFDGDGQHLSSDGLRLRQAFLNQNQSVHMGVRSFGKGVPLRSRFGNALTAAVFRFLTGVPLVDTQTGLRAMPQKVLPELLLIPNNGYDFEMEALLKFINLKIPIKSVEIETVYLDKNKSSHFRPLRDSLRIYCTFIKFLVQI